MYPQPNKNLKKVFVGLRILWWIVIRNWPDCHCLIILFPSSQSSSLLKSLSKERRISSVMEKLTLLGCHSTFLVNSQPWRNYTWFLSGSWSSSTSHALVVLRSLSFDNFYIVKIWERAPMGADLCPTVCSFLEVVERNVDNSTVEAALGEGQGSTHQKMCEKDGWTFQKNEQSLNQNKDPSWKYGYR